MSRHISGHALVCRLTQRGVPLACALATSVLLGCGDEAPSAAPESTAASTAPEAASLVAGAEALRLSGVTALDLRVDREGALLVYATQGEVLAARLDRSGARVGDAQRVASSDGRVRALVAGAAAGRVAVAWLRTEGGSARVERALGAGRPTVFGPPTELESWPTTEAEASAQIGAQDLALRVTPTGDFRLLHRATPMTCESSARCATFRHSGLGDDPSERRGSASLAATEVCPWALPGFVEASGRMYYGLCVLESGDPRTTLYLLQPEPQYAQAEPALAGCRPLGALTVPDPLGGEGEAALFAADCPDGRVAVSLGAPGVSVRPAGPVLSPVCTSTGPALRVGSVSIPLPAPRDRLEGFLHEGLAPAGSHVVWTGDEFLVAELVGSELSVRRWSCEAAAAMP